MFYVKYIKLWHDLEIAKIIFKRELYIDEYLWILEYTLDINNFYSFFLWEYNSHNSSEWSDSWIIKIKNSSNMIYSTFHNPEIMKVQV